MKIDLAKFVPAEGQAAEIQTAKWFFENSLELYGVMSHEGRLLDLNPAWEALTGWSRDELLGRDLADFLHPDSRAVVVEIRAALLRDGHAPTCVRMRRKDGGWLWLEGYSRVGPAGEVMGMLRDVSAERDRAEELDHARHVQSLLSETAGVGLWRYDPRTEQLHWSDEWRAMMDQTGVSVRTEGEFIAACHPDDVETVLEYMDAAVVHGRSGAYNHRFRAADGRWISIRAHIWAERISEGAHVVHGISQNVTEIAEARDLALQGQEQSRRILEQAPFAVAIFDEQLRYATVSPSWLATFSRDGRAHLGRRLDEIAPGVYDKVIAVQRRALEGFTTTSDEDSVVDSAGRERWLRWDVRPWRDADGAIIGVVVYVNDVSALSHARREAEAQAHRLRIALRAANAAVIEVDYVLGVHWTSEEFVKVIGRAITSDEAMQTVWPFVHAEDAGLVEAAVSGWRDGGPVEPLEFRIVRPLGDTRWVRMYTEIKKDPSGRWLCSVGLLMDIDDQKRQEASLIAAERAAQAGAETKARFLANMSHEIRTPMNGILGVLHLLKGHALPAPAQGLVTEALACGAMLQALLDDVVDISKMEAGKLEIEAQPTDPAALLASVVKILRPQAEDKGLSFSLEVKRLPPWILTDPTRLRQCLFNLIGNAVKFTGSGSVAIRACMRSTPAGPRLHCEVTDTGIGVSSAVQETLFERFQQADATTTRRFGGSGLGLAITRSLAEKMGGAVGMRSFEGKGSTFWIEVAAPTSLPPTQVSIGSDAMLDGVDVLVVEDNATNRKIVTLMLESLGASVSLAENGERGVEAALNGAFDLILMDIQMPGIDGLEATRRIRAAVGPVAATPILALTANVMSDQRQAYLDGGMNGVIAKPVSPAALILEISRLAAPSPAPLGPT